LVTATWHITLELAPWLLLGMAIAGLLHVALPTGFIRRQLTGRWGVVKAVVLGVPLPLCSCGVIPAGLGLKKDGATDGAAVGFLIATPQTGVDSVLVSASFLGWPFALFKVVAAGLTGVIGGYATERWGGERTVEDADRITADGTSSRGIREMVSHSIQIMRTIWLWLVFGVVVSAAITTWLPPGAFVGLSAYGGALALVAVLAISLPLYVCATASVPIAAALVAGGMPTGAALVFLMAGPASNVATIGAIYRGFGKRTLVIYLTTIIVGSIGLGALFDTVIDPATISGHAGHEHTAWWAVASAAIFIALLAWFAFEDLRQLIRNRGLKGVTDGPVIELEISGMTCGGCVNKLQQALQSADGVSSAQVTLDPPKATVRGTRPTGEIVQTIESAGFHAVQTESS
jgi:uncharacterized membrane protein YraQ (UPF0718 family)/copper chaperone CopZ